MSRKRESLASEAARVPWGEWVVAALGLVLLLGSVAVVLLHARGSDSPPTVTVRAAAVTQVGAQWLVEFDARNDGDEPAADVEVVGRTRPASGDPEEARAVLDYLAGHSAGRGGLYFTADPRAHNLELRAVGFRRP